MGSPLRRLGALSAALLLLGIPAAAHAAQPLAFGQIPCVAQSDGTRFCEGSTATRVHSFDGQPLDVNVALPATDGPAPLVLILHGYGGSKKAFDTRENPWLPTAHELAKRGYAVINPSDRGFGNSCGSLASRTLPDCATGWIHLLDTRFEVRDFQYLAGLLTDQGLAKPTSIGAIGESYGGGSSIMLATLKDRIMKSDGTLAPWTSPNGTPMAVAAATPTIPWSDLISSLTPNGRYLDYTVPQPKQNFTPRGVLKQSFVGGLYALGNISGFYSPPGVDHDSDLTSWFAITGSGEPTNTPPYDDLINIFVRYHGAQYVLDGEAVPNGEAPAPMLLSSGFTDDLFPPAETLRFANLVKALYPKVPLSLMYFDYGHQRGQNKQADVDMLREKINAWLDHYVLGSGATPKQDVTVLTQTCPKEAKSGGPFVAPNWDALSPGQIDLRSKPAQTVQSTGGDPSVSATFDPITGGGACATTSTATEPGTASYAFPDAKGAGYTMIGSPLIQAKIAITGPFSELAGRLFDVAPDGKQTLVARGVYRPNDADTSLIWQLSANAWRFAPGHHPRLQILGRDAPYVRASNGQFSVAISDVKITLPTRETKGKGLSRAKALRLPAGYKRAAAVPTASKKKPAKHHKKHAKKKRR
jgi:pimeloyl-ACP methyl ester carboxylesterase